MKGILQKSLEGNITDWDRHIPMVQLQMNVRVASLHSSSPFSLYYGRSFPGISDFTNAEARPLTEVELEGRLKYLTDLVFPAISEKSKETQKRMMDKFNSTHLIADFPVGSYVMAVDPLATSVFDNKYEGPFLVAERNANGSYVLKDAMHQTIPRTFAPEQLKHSNRSFQAETDDKDYYVVEHIISHERNERGEIQYKVKWKGYDEITDIPYDAFDSKAMINQYYKRLNQQNPHLLKK